ncbi:unnamed protein product [Coccothraustes coccothraustes]
MPRRLGQGIRGDAGRRGQALHHDRPLNPRCSTAARTAACLSPSHSTTSPPCPSEPCWTTTAPRCLRASLPGVVQHHQQFTPSSCVPGPAGTHTPLPCKATPASGLLSPSVRCCLQ